MQLLLLHESSQMMIFEEAAVDWKTLANGDVANDTSLLPMRAIIALKIYMKTYHIEKYTGKSECYFLAFLSVCLFCRITKIIRLCFVCFLF